MNEGPDGKLYLNGVSIKPRFLSLTRAHWRAVQLICEMRRDIFVLPAATA